MTRKIRILAICPDPQDGTGWYRAVSPFGRLQESRDDIDLSLTKIDVTHSDISRHDVLFLQRPVGPEHAQMARVAKSFGLAVWCDWDDPYLAVPITNPRYFIYKQTAVIEAIKECARTADVITVSSLQLQEDMKRINPRTALVPNALDETIAALPRASHEFPIRRVLWRGGDSHIEDLQHYAEAMVSASQSDAPHHVWSFWGVTPHWLMPRLPVGSAQIVGWCAFQDYYRNLQALRPNIVAVPLVDNHFNRCKSNIAAMEAFLAGAVPLVPRWPEWHIPEAMYYDGPDTFRKKLVKLMKMPTEELRERAAKGLAHVRAELSVAKVNESRSKILDALLDGHAPKWTVGGPATEAPPDTERRAASTETNSEGTLATPAPEPTGQPSEVLQ